MLTVDRLFGRLQSPVAALTLLKRWYSGLKIRDSCPPSSSSSPASLSSATAPKELAAALAAAAAPKPRPPPLSPNRLPPVPLRAAIDTERQRAPARGATDVVRPRAPGACEVLRDLRALRVGASCGVTNASSSSDSPMPTSSMTRPATDPTALRILCRT